MVEVWFIGGPWNHRLVRMSAEYARSPYIRVPVPHEVRVQTWTQSAVELIRYQDCKTPIVEYRRDRPLPTGIPVFTCL